MREYFKLSEFDKKITISMSIILGLTVVTRIFYDFNSFIGYIASVSILLSVSAIHGTIVANMIINRVKKIIKRDKVRRGGRDYRPLEFLFFIFIFIATIFLTYAMNYSSSDKVDNWILFVIYWLSMIFFYVLAVDLGKAHYIHGIHGMIKKKF